MKRKLKKNSGIVRNEGRINERFKSENTHCRRVEITRKGIVSENNEENNEGNNEENNEVNNS